MCREVTRRALSRLHTDDKSGQGQIERTTFESNGTAQVGTYIAVVQRRHIRRSESFAELHDSVLEVFCPTAARSRVSPCDFSQLSSAMRGYVLAVRLK